MLVPLNCYPQKRLLSWSAPDRPGIAKRLSRKGGEVMRAPVERPPGPENEELVTANGPQIREEITKRIETEHASRGCFTRFSKGRI
jgi:hypothetical protein